MIEALLEKIWQRRVQRGLPCVQGLCGRPECTTCQRQYPFWVAFWKTMGVDAETLHTDTLRK